MASAADDLCWMPAAQMAGLFRRRKLSPVEVMGAVLARIERLNPALNAFVTLTAETAMKAPSGTAIYSCSISGLRPGDMLKAG